VGHFLEKGKKRRGKLRKEEHSIEGLERGPEEE
jgi:hypothetical protein